MHSGDNSQLFVEHRLDEGGVQLDLHARDSRAQECHSAIWHGVSQKDVYDYSPSLAERVALQWSIGQDEVATRLTAVLLERKS